MNRYSDVIAEVFFAPSNEGVQAMEDDLRFGGEIDVEDVDAGNLIKSFLVYGAGKLIQCLSIPLFHE